MNSMIVDKFYSKLEKLGVKKHKVSQGETDYLNSLSPSKQLDAFNDETDFNIGRIRTKMHITFMFSLMFALITFYLIIVQIYLPIIASVLLCLTLLIFSKRYKTKMEIKQIEKYILANIKKTVISNTFR